MINKSFSLIFVFLLAVFLSVPGSADAAQQYDGLCSYVKMEILQEMSIERIGFLATLEVTNNEGDASITDFSAALTFRRQALEPGEEPSEASDLFFVRPPELEGITAIDGTGIIHPGETAVIKWFIIPKISAGGTDAIGLQYQVGAELGGSIYGMQIAPEILTVIPDTITVKPEAQLEITYFQPRDVDGDNPFTPDVVESPVPFTLGVLVKNSGYGRAVSVEIDSEQPRVTENLQGLLLVPSLLGSRVDDEPTDYSGLTLNLGTIEPGRCRKGAWDMITSLSGEFSEFNATYTHASELGGRDTSIISSLDACFLIHEVLNDQPGRDELLDFLADTSDGAEMIPDTLFESDCLTTPVNQAVEAEITDYNGTAAGVRAAAGATGWVFIRLDDPAQAKYAIAEIVRADGKVLDSHNYWTNIRYRNPDNKKLTYLNIFDFVSSGEVEYTVTYAMPGADLEPPATSLLFAGAWEEKEGINYILPETQLMFMTEDSSPTATYYRLDSAEEFVPAIPFTIAVAGEHILHYYSRDAAGNTEDEKTADIVVAGEFPQVDNISTSSAELLVSGDSVSIRPDRISVGFNAVTGAATLRAEADVFSGVMAWPSLDGVPASPAVSREAEIAVLGENLDFYRYRLGSGAWSGEFSVDQPLSLTGLDGEVELAVAGRNATGVYDLTAEGLVGLMSSLNHGVDLLEVLSRHRELVHAADDRGWRPALPHALDEPPGDAEHALRRDLGRRQQHLQCLVDDLAHRPARLPRQDARPLVQVPVYAPDRRHPLLLPAPPLLRHIPTDYMYYMCYI